MTVPRRAHPPARALAGLALAAALVLPTGCRTSAPRSDRTAAARPADPRRAALAEGDAARRDGRLDDAIGTWRRLVEEAPSFVPGHARLVEALVGAGRRAEARDLYAARATRPDATSADRVFAARLATDGSPAAVRRVWVEAARAEPDDPWWRLALAEVDLAAAARALDARETARAAGDRPRVEAYDLRARAALSRTRSALDNASRRDPSLPEVSLYGGLLRSFEAELVASAEGRRAAIAAAVEAFRQATRADPTLVDAWANLGDASARAGDLAGAIAAYGEAVRLAPDDAALRDGLGRALHDAERHEDAAAQYAEAARLVPRDGRPLLDAGDSWAATGAFERALASYDEALHRDPLAVEGYAKRGAVLERLGRLAEAREAYATYVDKGGRETADVRRRIEKILAPTREAAR